MQPEQVYALRGFPLDVERYPRGTGLTAAYAEYRFPLVHIERGIDTLPFYFERLHMATFFEAGNTFGDGGEDNIGQALAKAKSRLRGLRAGTGMELRADVSLGWAFPLTFRLGMGFPIIDKGRLNNRPPLFYLNFGSAI